MEYKHSLNLISTWYKNNHYHYHYYCCTWYGDCVGK